MKVKKYCNEYMSIKIKELNIKVNIVSNSHEQKKTITDHDKNNFTFNDSSIVKQFYANNFKNKNER